MKNKINIAELLHNCPKGMELDCTMYEDVYFDYVDELNQYIKADVSWEEVMSNYIQELQSILNDEKKYIK